MPAQQPVTEPRVTSGTAAPGAAVKSCRLGMAVPVEVVYAMAARSPRVTLQSSIQQHVHKLVTLFASPITTLLYVLSMEVIAVQRAVMDTYAGKMGFIAVTLPIGQPL